MDLNPYPNRNAPVIDTTKIDFPFSLPYNASDENEVSLVLYTQQNPSLGQEIKLDKQWFKNSFYNSAHLTKYVIHGWFSSQFTPSIADIRKEYLKHGEYNVVSDLKI